MGSRKRQTRHPANALHKSSLCIANKITATRIRAAILVSLRTGPRVHLDHSQRHCATASRLRVRNMSAQQPRQKGRSKHKALLNVPALACPELRSALWKRQTRHPANALHKPLLTLAKEMTESTRPAKAVLLPALQRAHPDHSQRHRPAASRQGVREKEVKLSRRKTRSKRKAPHSRDNLASACQEPRSQLPQRPPRLPRKNAHTPLPTFSSGTTETTRRVLVAVLRVMQRTAQEPRRNIRLLHPPSGKALLYPRSGKELNRP